VHPSKYFPLDPAGDKSIAHAGESFDVERMIRRIAQGCAQLLYGVIHAVLEIHERIGRPQALAEFFAGDDFAGMLQEDGQDVEGLTGQSHAGAVFAEFARGEAHFEGTEAYAPGLAWRLRHFCYPCREVYH
jgi:hypothetical protein